MVENKISQESAELQIRELLDYFLIDKTDIEIEDGEAAVQTMFNTLTRAIRRGLLEIEATDGLKVTQHLQNSVDDLDKITYEDKVSKARIAMDKGSSKNDAQGKMYTFMSTLCSVPVSGLLKLKGADVTVFNRLSVVFSMV